MKRLTSNRVKITLTIRLCGLSLYSLTGNKRRRMQTQITTRHVELNPDLRSYISQQLDKLQRYYDNIISAHVILGQNNTPAQDKTAEINIDVYQQRLSAEDAAPTHEEAVNLCVDHLRRQLKRYKAKLRSTDKDAHR